MVQADTVDIQPLESTYISWKGSVALNATYLKLEKEVYSGRDA